LKRHEPRKARRQLLEQAVVSAGTEHRAGAQRDAACLGNGERALLNHLRQVVEELAIFLG